MKGTILEIFLEEERLVKMEVSPQADRLDAIACFEALQKSLDASGRGNSWTFDSLEAEEPATGRNFKTVCLEKAY
jgi:hypothetical protein